MIRVILFQLRGETGCRKVFLQDLIAEIARSQAALAAEQASHRATLQSSWSNNATPNFSCEDGRRRVLRRAALLGGEALASRWEFCNGGCVLKKVPALRWREAAVGEWGAETLECVAGYLEVLDGMPRSVSWVSDLKAYPLERMGRWW